jgi:hypothetical protein
MGHTNIPPALRERYIYPFWLYLLPIFAWLIQTGVGGAAGVLLARRTFQVVKRNTSTSIVAIVLLTPQIAAWCYITHAIMWSSNSFLLQTIEFIPATAIFLLFGYASTRSIIKPDVTLPCTA